MAKGKCVSCKVIYEWEGKPLLRDSGCPRCASPLRATSKQSHLPVRRVVTGKVVKNGSFVRVVTNVPV